jgi:hypothetical protein
LAKPKLFNSALIGWVILVIGQLLEKWQNVGRTILFINWLNLLFVVLDIVLTHNPSLLPHLKLLYSLDVRSNKSRHPISPSKLQNAS